MSQSNPYFSDQANQPPTTKRVDFAPKSPYAKQFQSTAISPLVYNEALIKKYNRSGPRYTSYPTAVEFKPIEAGVELDVLTSRDPNTPVSLYVHIPFCRHLCYYCGCNKIITKKNGDASDYLQYLKQEVARKRALLTPPTDGGKPYVKQLHLGGGTPTFFTDAELTDLWQFLQTQFDFAPSQLSEQSKQLDQSKPDQHESDFLNGPEFIGDYSIEIDPREIRDTTLKTLRQLGFNRLSFGVQDLQPEVQIAVNRVQSEALIQTVMTEARQLGFASINIDLIYGLPHQTPQTFAHTVERILKLSPDRLSIFNYAHLPTRFKAQQKIKDEDLPSPANKLTMFSQTVSTLTEAGYQYIGIDHFAKADDPLATAQRGGKLHRNFQGYTLFGDVDLLGFGVSSISQINSTVYANRGNSSGHILQNATDLDAYKADIYSGKLPTVKHIKTNIKDRLRGYVIMNLLCHDYVDFKDLNQKFGIDAIPYFIEEIQQLGDMQQDKLIDMDAAGIRILPKGRLLARNVAMVFDTYLESNQKDRFSKVI